MPVLLHLKKSSAIKRFTNLKKLFICRSSLVLSRIKIRLIQALHHSLHSIGCTARVNHPHQCSLPTTRRFAKLRSRSPSPCVHIAIELSCISSLVHHVFLRLLPVQIAKGTCAGRVRWNRYICVRTQARNHFTQQTWGWHRFRTNHIVQR